MTSRPGSDRHGTSVQILGMGGCTAVGRTMLASAAAARARVTGFSEHPFVLDLAGEAMRIARAPWIDSALTGTGRFAALASAAMDEALAGVSGLRERARPAIALYLALPAPRPGLPDDLYEELPHALARRHDGGWRAVRVTASGHASGYVALAAALEELAHGVIDAALIVGVDSYISSDTLMWLEACEQVQGAGHMNNAWGFIPGEAAGALLVAGRRLAEDAQVTPWADVLGVGCAHEPHPIKSDGVCVGEGLSAACRAALAAASDAGAIADIFCDLNGETYRADEYGFTMLRIRSRLRAGADFVAPADCWGDVGAASAPLCAALAAIAQRKAYSRGPVSLICGSSESGERGAAVIAAAQARG